MYFDPHLPASEAAPRLHCCETYPQSTARFSLPFFAQSRNSANVNEMTDLALCYQSRVKDSTWSYLS